MFKTYRKLVLNCLALFISMFVTLAQQGGWVAKLYSKWTPMWGWGHNGEEMWNRKMKKKVL